MDRGRVAPGEVTYCAAAARAGFVPRTDINPAGRPSRASSRRAGVTCAAWPRGHAKRPSCAKLRTTWLGDGCTSRGRRDGGLAAADRCRVSPGEAAATVTAAAERLGHGGPGTPDVGPGRRLHTPSGEHCSRRARSASVGVHPVDPGADRRAIDWCGTSTPRLDGPPATRRRRVMGNARCRRPAAVVRCRTTPAARRDQAAVGGKHDRRARAGRGATLHVRVGGEVGIKRR